MKSKLGFKDKLIKSNYGSKAEIVARGEFMFSEAVKELNELPFSMDMSYALQITILRDKAELINYVLTGSEIPDRSRGGGQ